MLDTLKYIFTRYILKFGLPAAVMVLFFAALLATEESYNIPSFFTSGWNILLIFVGAFLSSWAHVKFPFRTKADICAKKGHKQSGCMCTRCKTVVDSSLHVWDGCKCSVCGAQKDNDDPLHQWNDCVCTHCGATRDGDHSWVKVSSTSYGGNDVNGWGPGGSTITQYVCSRCGMGREDTSYDDDSDDGDS